MKTMLSIMLSVTLVVSTVASALAAGDTTAAPQPGASPAASSELTDGEVRKIDPEAQKITLRHGEIRNLGVPPVTMVFQVTDPALLGQVKAGDKVRFSAEKRNGALVVTRIEAAK